MNQILSTEMNKGKKSNSKVADIKKVIMFFVIAIIILGIVMLVKGAVTVYTNVSNNIEVEQTEPEVKFEQISGNEDEIKLTINHDKPITKITYNWNDGQEITIPANNRTSITQTITLPTGTNMLTIKITDEIQSVATIQKEFTKEESKLSLSFARVGDKIKITATDTQEIAYLTYKWNSEDAKKIEIDENSEDKKTLEVEVDILEGLNTLTVVATNKNGQTKTKTQDIEGTTSPKISVQKDGEYLIINAKDDNILTLINYTLNNQPYRINLTVYDANYYNAIEGLTVKTNQEGKIIEMEYRQLMTEKGTNILTLTAENNRGAITTYSGQCTND